MDVLILIVGIACLVVTIAGFVFAYRNREDKPRALAFGAVAIAGLVGVVLALFGLGRKRPVEVVEVKPHVRTAAPSERDVVELDVTAQNHDEDRAALEDRIDETDKRIEALDTADPDSDEPDPDIASRLRRL